jgi:hypothetical protein
MNDAGAGPRAELDLEALARGDRVAADVLVELCRGDRAYVLDPDVFAALMTLSKTRSLARHWEALLAQLRSVRVDVPALRRALRAADEIEDDDDSNEDESQAHRLLTIADRYEYFRDEFETPFMTVEVEVPGGGSRPDTMRINSKRAKLFFVDQYTRAYGKPPSDTALNGVLAALAAKAMFGDVIHSVSIRRAHYNGKIYLDRGTSDGSAYEIDKDGPRVVARPPLGVRFLRPPGMKPLVEAVFIDPKEGLRELWKVTRFQSERDFVLVVGFALDALGGKGPYSVLVITGEPGSAKSTLARILGFLIDPQRNDLLLAPNSSRDVYIAASKRGLVIFNNLSELSKPISDAISTAGEGGSNSQRALYTDEDESAIYSKAPFILVGINNVVTRGDLANRTLKTELAAMPKGEHLSETKFWAKVEKAAPVILGALLSALSEGLRRHDSIEEKGLPRLASFAKFVSACETCFWPAGTFLKAFTEAAAEAADETLSNDPVVEVFQEFMADKKEWKGTATVLLRELENVVRGPAREAELAFARAKNEARNSSGIPGKFRTDAEKAADGEASRRMAEAFADLKEARERVHTTLGVRWPKAANSLSRRLRDVGPQLKDAGLQIRWPNSHGDEKVLTVVNTIFDPLKTGSRPNHIVHPVRPSAPADFSDIKRQDNNAFDDDINFTDEHDFEDGTPSPTSTAESSKDAPGSQQPDLSSGSASSPKPNEVPTSDRSHSPKLHKGPKGFEI